jgi:imidazolonepropionase
MTEPFVSTLIIRHIGELLTMADSGEVTEAQGTLGIIRDSAIVAQGGQIVFAGPDAALDATQFGDDGRPETTVIDAGGRLVTPGLIDAHTHLIFAGDRSAEFHLRHAGASYEEIQARGGGIATTMRATRDASDTELLDLARRRLLTMRRHGTTTVEAKSGYGLNHATEDRLLSLAAQLASESAMPRVIPTFLGAHVVPPEFKDRRDAYVSMVRDEWLPAFAGRARFCDAFCEHNAFTSDETRSILTAARGLGYHLKLHANQLGDSGGAALAVELGATSADHLDHASDADLERLAAAGVVAVLLPGCSFTLNTPYPQARRYLGRGLRVALATDFNPGTSYCENLQMMVELAIAHMGMTIEEALLAVTRRGAEALALDEAGIIAPGKRCDLVLWQCRSHSELAYHFGVNLVDAVIIGGTSVMD